MPCPVTGLDDAEVPFLNPYPDDLQAHREELYQHGPVTPVELPGGVRAWATTHHAAAKAALKDPRFVKDPHQWADFTNGKVSKDWPYMGVLTFDGINMLGLDGAPHRRMRRLTAHPFSARRVERLRPKIERITDEYLDALEPRAHEPLDLKKEFSFRVPITVIGELYGVGREEYDKLGELYAPLFFVDTDPGEHLKLYAQIHEYFTELVARKRADPGGHDDFTTDLINSTEEGEDPLTEAEVIVTLLMVVAAGHETTVNLINNVVRALVNHPEWRERLGRGEITWDQVVEETLRYNPPNNALLFRFATEDVSMGDVTVKKGDALVTHYGAITKDREEYGEDVHVFDPTRTKGRHITFGFGPHMCPGAPLARLEAGIILPKLFARFPDLTLAVADEELENEAALIVNSLKEFPILLRP
ncbi:cytochrome P450 family protein [Nocardiopsis oceani]